MLSRGLHVLSFNTANGSGATMIELVPAAKVRVHSAWTTKKNKINKSRKGDAYNIFKISVGVRFCGFCM